MTIEARQKIAMAISVAAEWLRAREMKSSRRDPVEPGVIHKTRFDKQLSTLLGRHFDQQRAAIEQYLGMGGRLPIPEHILKDDALTADLTRTLMAAALDGISQVTDEIGIGFDDTLTNKEAAVWARQHAGEMITQVDAASLDAVQSAITTFADTPGFTLADVMARLPYDTARAERIAVTEITRAYAEANQLVGQQLGTEFAGTTVVKIWYTNNDDKVCPICAPLNGKEVGIGDEFDADISNPPAHPNCRCWTTTSTRIA